MKVIHTDNAPQAIGPYSQAIVTVNLVFASGQIAIVPSTGAIVEGGIVEQTELVCKNIGELHKLKSQESRHQTIGFHLHRRFKNR